MELPTPLGTSIRIFLADGGADGVRVVEKSNWTGKALMAPRTRYRDLRARTDLDGPGVYLLVGPTESGLPASRVYVGETDDLPGRLDSHNRNKDFWSRAEERLSSSARLHPSGKDTKAEGTETAEGFVVYAGSLARAFEVPSMHAYGTQLRTTLIEKGLFVETGPHLRLTEDYVFASPVDRRDDHARTHVQRPRRVEDRRRPHVEGAPDRRHRERGPVSTDPVLSLVLAMDRNRLIGADGGLPWRIPGELAHFKAVTMGKPVVMGRKTHESIGRPLPGRTNVVLTTDPTWHRDGVHVAHALDDALGARARAGPRRRRRRGVPDRRRRARARRDGRG